MTQSASKQLTSVLVAAALILGFAFAFAAPAKADTVSDLQAQIAALMAQISGLQGGSTTSSSAACFTFTRNHKNGDKGGEVMQIQKFLNSSADTQVAATGAGSSGNETSTFGPATKKAVIKFQEKYAADILTPAGLTKGTGNWFAGTRAKANALCTTTTGGTTGGTTTGGTTQTPTGTGVTIAAAAQPANTLAPKGATRVPFTTFTLTNTTGAAVTVTGITVQRTGLAHDAAFSGVVLLDQNGLQVGISHTFNSNHQSVIGDGFTLAAGQSMTYTVAGNLATDLSSYTGEVASISVVSVNTSVPVSGTLPITGAQQTLNNSLSIGSISTSTSAYDPGSAQTKSIGDTAIRFSGVRFTAGSNEDVKLFSVRWRQSGTASNADLANIVTVVGGTSYPTVLDASGKYYTTQFPGGILIAKGNNVDMYVQGDAVGTGAADRTVIMNIDKLTDVYFVGQTYGYGIAAGSVSYNPWYAGNTTTIRAGSVTTISKATEVAAQNIAVNVQNQPLGGFVTDFKGEAVNVTTLNVGFATSSTWTSGLLTQVTIVDENGVTVAGPVDTTYNTTSVSGTTMVAAFTDSITFPLGRHVYTIKGKVPSGTPSNATVYARVTPSGWGGKTGQTTGNTVSITTDVFSMNTMTVRAGSLNVGLSTTPGNQSIVGSGIGILFANLQLDASQSGEDVRVTNVKFRTTSTTGLSACQAFDGSTALNTGSNVPSSYTSGTTANTLTFDNSLIIAKGTVKTLALKCNLSSGSSTYRFSVDSSDTISVTGQTSGASITASYGNLTGGTMTVAAGALAVTLDSASPSYSVAAAGSTGVVLGSYKFHATNEAVNLTRIGLMMTSGSSTAPTSASSTAADLTQVTLWANGVQIGTATFVGTDVNATSTSLTNVQVPKDGDLIVTVKGDLAAQGSSASSYPGALVLIDVDTNGTDGNKNTSGTGANSGVTINPSGTTAVSGVRVFKSYPTVAKLTPQSTTLVAQGGVELYRFSVTANSAGDIALDKFVVNIATSSFSGTNGTTSVTNVKIYGYTDSALSNAVSGFTSGLIATVNSGGGVNSGNNAATTSSALAIPAGQTRWFKIVGDVAQEAGSSGSAGSVTTKIVGDSAYPSLATLMGSANGVSSSNFIWSPLSTSTTPVLGSTDWTNGYQIPGLPSAGTDSVTLSK